MKNKSKWFYCFNINEGDGFLKLEHEDVPENPTDEELNAIAQKLLRKYGYTGKDDFVSIGKGKLLTIEELGGCLGDDIIEILNNNAYEYCDDAELFSAARKEDIEDLDRRIAQTLKEWAAERNVMSIYYMIPDTKEFYYRGDTNEKSY